MSEDQLLQPIPASQKNTEIRILELSAQPYPDNRRVKVNFQLSPFLKAPNAAITMTNQENEQVAAANIVNIFNLENEITLHIPFHLSKPGGFSVHLTLFIIEEDHGGEEESGKITLNQTDFRTLSTSFKLQ